jgi:hypothetical protein
VRVDRSYVGEGDFLITPVSLDPRLEGGTPRLLRPPSAPPTARIARPPEGSLTVERGEAFELDGGPSQADEGRTLDWYRWKRLQ